MQVRNRKRVFEAINVVAPKQQTIFDTVSAAFPLQGSSVMGEAALGAGQLRLNQVVRVFPTEMGNAGAREKLWHLDPYFHCSVIGTCVSTGELRKLVARIRSKPVDGYSDVDIHHMAVEAASSAAFGGKFLHKALDQRHVMAIRRSERARTELDLREFWEAAKRDGDIPAGYWAVLTHRAASKRVRDQAFSDVHMLSHLLGAANRADIRRLALLESENTDLVAKVERQERVLREGIVARDVTIRRLSVELANRIEQQTPSLAAQGSITGEQQETLQDLIRILQRKLNHESASLERAVRRAAAAEAEAARMKSGLVAAQHQIQELRHELDVVSVQPQADGVNGAAGQLAADYSLPGRTLLYIGGRPATVTAIANLVEEAGATFLHHDGGIEDRKGKVTADVYRADIVFFPVDCVSHDATYALKRACRAAGKPYYPLRTSSITSFVAALNEIASDAWRGNVVSHECHF